MDVIIIFDKDIKQQQNRVTQITNKLGKTKFSIITKRSVL